MEEQNTDPIPEPIKPDLKHDTMEYSASTEGDDILDSDKETTQEMEEEEITAEELALLEEDDPDTQAQALDIAETDSQADEDNFLIEEKEDYEIGDISNDSAGEESEDEFRRK